MSLEILKWGISLVVFLSIAVFIFAVKGIKNDMPEETRQYLDPLPPMLRMIWPMVNLFTYYVGDRISVDTLEKYNRMLRQSGVSYLMSPAQYVGLRVSGALLMSLLAIILMLLLESFDWTYLLCAAVLGFYMPLLSLRDLKAKRNKTLIRQLPTYLDFLTMSVQAGMNFTGALQQAVEKGPEGEMKVEFSKVLRDITAGMSRLDSIREMADRNQVREITAFATSIIQAEKTGSSLGNTLKIQADQRRVERFQRAEKLAMEAPVKLIFPLVAFIFPMTFLILGFPIVMKFIYDV